MNPIKLEQEANKIVLENAIREAKSRKDIDNSYGVGVMGVISLLLFVIAIGILFLSI